MKSKQQKLLLLSEYIDLVEFYLKRCCKCRKKQNPEFVVVVTTRLDEEDDSDGDDDENGLQQIKRTVEQKFRNLETLINKKMIKGLH